MRKDSPTAKGNVALSIISTALGKKHRTVSVPLGDGHSYDLVVDIDGKLHRVQCKTGKLKNGAIVIRLYTVDRQNKQHGYSNLADLFAIYCYETDKVYLVPVVECVSQSLSLRVNETQSQQKQGIHWAKDYELR